VIDRSDDTCFVVLGDTGERARWAAATTRRRDLLP
jgi:hypothetical protein